MADFYITGVRYHDAHPQRIERVQIQSLTGPTQEHSRQAVVDLLEDGKVLFTASHDSEGALHQGKKVIVETLRHKHYIKTIWDATEADNLSPLPQF